MDTVHVLLPVHNRREVTLGFVRCLSAQTYQAIRLLLIDDGSTDGTETAVRAAYPSVEVMRGPGSWWWAGCLQRGLHRLAREGTNNSDVVLFANDDTTFAPDYVERAIQYLAGKQGCMLLSRYLDATTGRVEESGVCADLRTLAFLEAKDPATINCLSTRGLFVRWGDVKRIGGLHPVLLPHYWSDYEYTMRALRKGLTAFTSESVWIEANASLSGTRDLSSLSGWRFLSELFSRRCLTNPIYKSSFVLLACPLRWTAANLARIWWQASLQVLRQGLLPLAPSPVASALRTARMRLRRIFKAFRLKLQISTVRPVRIVLGSGGIAEQGWIATDIEQLNVLVDRDWRRHFSPGSVDVILAEHVWEHLSPEEGIDAARLCFKYLRPGGYLRIAVPDGLHPDPKYVEAVKPGGTGAGAEDHKVLYSCDMLRNALSNAGFETHALEYFDRCGQFHSAAWDPAGGKILRSARFDERNRSGELHYTSIIVDAVKPA
jgi:predicted SAM-dependent methyltransferase/GT2 family glycosyltransferase